MLFNHSGHHFYHDNALNLYDKWENLENSSPTAIISDGPYGVNGYPGDPKKPALLAEWYSPHVEAWTHAASEQTTLWFWGTEISWASVHPVLAEAEWVYEGLHIWDKGISHVAGNVNSKTIRRFPVVTEVCARYTRPMKWNSMPIQQWLRAEWLRTGLALNKANEACGVKNAASRKYLTVDENWYFPPDDVFQNLSEYANTHGDPAGRPYFGADRPEKVHRTMSMRRAKWFHQHGLTNVWSQPALRGRERLKVKGKSVHSNQKPLNLIERIIRSSTEEGDVVWDPFAGLGTVTAASINLNRRSYASEIDEHVADTANIRLSSLVS